MRKKSNNNFVQEQPKQGWAYFEESNQWRRTPAPWGAPRNHFPREYGDWVAVSRPAGWQPPAGTLAGESLLGGGAGLNAAESGSGGGTASGTKIGAGHKPQPYGWHGYYGETGGGLSGGAEVRGKVTLPHEVRGKVTPPAQTSKVAPPPSTAPAEVTWKNDNTGNHVPTHQDLEQRTRDTVENLRTDNPELDSINVNSGKRGGTGPHAEGRAVDINKVNGVSVSDLGAPKTPEAERAKVAAEKMVEQAKIDPNVNQVLGPTGCWERDENRRWRQLDPEIPRDQGLINGHKDHYHINVYRK